VVNLDASDGRGSRVEGLEAHHGPSDPLDEPVILFKNIFEIFDTISFSIFQPLRDWIYAL